MKTTGALHACCFVSCELVVTGEYTMPARSRLQLNVMCIGGGMTTGGGYTDGGRVRARSTIEALIEGREDVNDTRAHCTMNERQQTVYRYLHASLELPTVTHLAADYPM